MTTLKAQKAAEVLANRKAAFEKKVGVLIGHAAGRVPMIEMRRAFEAGRSADDFAAEIAAREPVGKALHSQKADAVKSAAADAAEVVASVEMKLEAAGWDITQVASYPGTYDRDYKAKRAYYSLVSGLTENAEEGYRHYPKGQPHPVKMSEEGIDRFIRRAEEAAAIQYDMYICKMVAKIGPDAVDATINGSHVWDHSVLAVAMADGSTQRWHTQQIWNTSVHGLRFPQWPSRKLK